MTMSEIFRSRRLSDARVPLLLCGLIAAVGFGSLAFSESLQRQLIADLIFLIAAVGLYMFTGMSGILSFGHMSFAAIGGYAAAILVIAPETKTVILPELPGFLAATDFSPVAATLLAGAVGGLFAAVVGIALMRAPGMAATLASFALLVILNSVAVNWRSVTGGSQGMVSVPMTTTIGTVVTWACVAVISAHLLQRSRWGIRLVASREDDAAARSLGVGVAFERWIAWTLSAFFTGIAGALYAQLIGSFTPGVFYLDATFLVIVMLIIGGRTSLAGAVVGAFVISFAGIALRRAEDGFSLLAWEVEPLHGLRAVGLAVIMLAVLLRRPDGLMVARPESSTRAPGRIATRFARRPRPLTADPTPQQEEKSGQELAASNKGEQQ